jgi:hypothetical protein
MRAFLSAALAAGLLFTGLAPATAQQNPEIIERGKKATALVEVKIPGRESSTSIPPSSSRPSHSRPKRL